MNIGIFTQPLNNNYGGILQNYALQQILISLGYRPITVDYRPVNKLIRYLLSQCKTFILLFIPGKKRPFLKFSKEKERNILMSEFVEKHIITTERLEKITRHIVQKYNFHAIISGSDQVWRPLYNANLKYSYLSFAKSNKIKKIAYAASFGVDEWEYSAEQTKQCSKLAKRFDAISVREASGVRLCKTYLNVEAITVLDPTLMLSVKKYSLLCDTIPIDSKPFLLVYMLDLTDEKKIFFDRIFNYFEYVRVVCMSK